MGKTRESQGWYWRGRNLLTQEVLDHRLSLLNEIIAMLVPNLTKQRNYTK